MKSFNKSPDADEASSESLLLGLLSWVLPVAVANGPVPVVKRLGQVFRPVEVQLVGLVPIEAGTWQLLLCRNHKLRGLRCGGQLGQRLQDYIDSFRVVVPESLRG